MPEHSHRELILQGETHFEQGVYMDALDLFEQVLDHDPDNVHALNDAGLTAAELAQTKRAVEYFERALAVHPDFEPAFFGLLDVLVGNDELDAAVHAFLRYEEHIPNTAEKQQYADLLTERTAPATPHAERIREAEELLMQDQPREALAILTEVLEQDPENANALNDAGHAYADLGEAVEASQCFENALEADPSHQSAFYSLIDLLVRNESPELAVEVFLKYHEDIPDDDEKGEYADALGDWAQVQMTDPASGDGLPGTHDVTAASFPVLASDDGLRIAIVCGPDRKFITDIENGLHHKGHAIHTCYFDDKVDLDSIQQAMDWADVTWFEWCDEILVHASQNLRKTSPVVCRLHGYEVFAGYPSRVRWHFVDRLAFVIQHKLDLFEDQWPDVPVEKTIISNGVNLDRFTLRPDKRNTKNLVLLGNLNYRKGLPMLMQFYSELLRREDGYHLYIRGQWQDLRYKMATETMIDELDLQDEVTFVDQWIDDLDGWLADKSHILSFSLEESFHYAVGEAMAAGLKPVVHAWRGSRHTWPDEFIFRDLEDFLQIVRGEDYEPEAYRGLIESTCPVQNQLDAFDELLTEIDRTAPGTDESESPISSQYWEERYSSGGHSGAGSYGRLASFKARVINDFAASHDVQSVIDFGCGDGNQLALATYPKYLGVDVSETAVRVCRDIYQDDETKRFDIYDPDTFDPSSPSRSADLALSLDVIYHLLEDDVFETYMEHLFRSSNRYVIIYSNDADVTPPGMSPHIRFRKFTEWVTSNAPDWNLIDVVENPYPVNGQQKGESFCDFYIYEKSISSDRQQEEESVAASGHQAHPAQPHATTVAIPQTSHNVLFADSGYARPYIDLYNRGYELALVQMLEAAVSTDTVFVDVGAHLGYFTLLAAKLGAKAHSYEPNPRSFEQLQRNVGLNELEDLVSLHQVALGTSEGAVPFFEKAHLDAGSSLYQNVERQQVVQGRSMGNVRLQDAARVLAELNLTEASVVKIDIEGAEYELIPHAAEEFERTRPTLLVEFHPFNLVTSDDPYLNHLERLDKNVRIAQSLNFYRYIYFMEEGDWHCVERSTREEFYHQHFLKPRKKENIRSMQSGFLDNYVFSDSYLL